MEMVGQSLEANRIIGSLPSCWSRTPTAQLIQDPQGHRYLAEELTSLEMSRICVYTVYIHIYVDYQTYVLKYTT